MAERESFSGCRDIMVTAGISGPTLDQATRLDPIRAINWQIAQFDGYVNMNTPEGTAAASGFLGPIREHAKALHAGALAADVAIAYVERRLGLETPPATEPIAPDVPGDSEPTPEAPPVSSRPRVRRGN